MLPALLTRHGFGMPAEGVTLASAHPDWAAGAARLIAALPPEVRWA